MKPQSLVIWEAVIIELMPVTRVLINPGVGK